MRSKIFRPKYIFRALIAVGLIFLAYTIFRPRHAYVGIMVPLEEAQEKSQAWNIAETNKRGDKFSGPTTLKIGDNEIYLPRALVAFFSHSDYMETLHVLEYDGRYTREEAIDQWIAYAEMAKALPEWHDEGNLLENPYDMHRLYQALAAEYGIMDYPTIRERAEVYIDLIGPDLPLGTRKVPLLISRYKLTINGRNFFPSFDINMTYDKDRPNRPYRFAFYSGLHSRSLNCLLPFTYFFADFFEKELLDSNEEERDFSVLYNKEDAAFYDPNLLKAFEGWDYQDTSLSTIRPYLDKYIFEICDKNAQTWEEL